MTVVLAIIVMVAFCVLLGHVLERIAADYPLSGPDHQREGVGPDRSLTPGTVRAPTRSDAEGWHGGHGYPPGRPAPRSRDDDGCTPWN